MFEEFNFKLPKKLLDDKPLKEILGYSSRESIPAAKKEKGKGTSRK